MSQSQAPFPYPESEQRLAKQLQKQSDTRISDLLAEDASRAETYSITAANWHLDYSRQQLNDEIRNSLLILAEEAGLSAARDGLFDGRILNPTEDRAVLHCLLRAADTGPELQDKLAAVYDCRNAMAAWVERVHSGEHRGFGGDTITDIVNLGIGGSDLGPRMVVQALRPCHTGTTRVHFCANIDPADLASTLGTLDPARTLFIICSKTLRTEETLHNGRAAQRWLRAAGANEADLAKHFLAVSTNLETAAELGIPPDNILPMWDWVGGRFSLWSAIGWSIAFAVGAEGFAELLAGAEEMDTHFRTAPLADNMPVWLSLLEIWNVNFLGAGNQAVIPYSHDLRSLPAFLQQLSMESNGKRVNHEGLELAYATAPVLWGEAGTNGQHSFHQLLHQGKLLCPVDFILPLQAGESSDPEGRDRLVANCLSQARALLQGRDEAGALQSLLDRGYAEQEARKLAPHLVIPGNRPSSTLSCSSLNPRSLGALIALYEHKTFCSGHIWQINSFDQWGVELGKEISAGIYRAMDRGEAEDLDDSTRSLLERYRNER